MNDEETVRRAEQARAILESPLWVAAWDAFRAHQIEKFEFGPPNEIDEARRTLLAGQMVRAQLTALIRDGKISKETIEREKKRMFDAL